MTPTSQTLLQRWRQSRWDNQIRGSNKERGTLAHNQRHRSMFDLVPIKAGKRKSNQQASSQVAIPAPSLKLPERINLQAVGLRRLQRIRDKRESSKRLKTHTRLALEWRTWSPCMHLFVQCHTTCPVTASVLMPATLRNASITLTKLMNWYMAHYIPNFWLRSRCWNVANNVLETPKIVTFQLLSSIDKNPEIWTRNPMHRESDGVFAHWLRQQGKNPNTIFLLQDM